MKVLLVEGQPGVASEIEAELRAAGHQVTGCDAADPSVPCRGLDQVGDCPLDANDVDVAVVGRVGGPLTAAERGALCAARRRIPVVVGGDPRNAVSFGPGTHMARDDLVAACERAAQSGDAHVAAVRRSLLIAGVLTQDDVDGPDAPVSFDVRREPRRLRMVVNASADEPRLASIAESAGEALRRFDPYTDVIDVVTETS
jgi:hypothetical protein